MNVTFWQADVIMALAGSSGGSWSTGLSHKPKSKYNTSDGPYKLGQMYEGGSSRETPFLAPEFRARPSHQATSGACHRIFTQPGDFFLKKNRFSRNFCQLLTNTQWSRVIKSYFAL